MDHQSFFQRPATEVDTEIIRNFAVIGKRKGAEVGLLAGFERAQAVGAAQGVGGNQDDNVATENSGAVYVFRRAGTAWEQAAYIKASNTAKDDSFGRGVALSGDTLAVTAILEDSAATGVNSNQDDNNAMDSGAVYVFH